MYLSVVTRVQARGSPTNQAGEVRHGVEKYFRDFQLLIVFNRLYYYLVSVPVAARSKAKVFGRSPAEIVGSNPTGGMDVCLL